jgi:hypothetical protein
MKPPLILLAVFIAFAQVAAAGDVKLAWEPNTQPELAGYRLGLPE